MGTIIGSLVNETNLHFLLKTVKVRFKEEKRTLLQSMKQTVPLSYREMMSLILQ